MHELVCNDTRYDVQFNIYGTHGTHTTQDGTDIRHLNLSILARQIALLYYLLPLSGNYVNFSALFRVR
jgi:hypothetical protein